MLLSEISRSGKQQNCHHLKTKIPTTKTTTTIGSTMDIPKNEEKRVYKLVLTGGK